jgi:type I restriction enzyme R subunit
VYQKYGAIFRYFDSLLVGLTATPREEVDKNTYELFDLEPGVPTDAYELTEAVNDGFLVPPHVEQVDLRFPREGIDYESLSDEEKAAIPAVAARLEYLASLQESVFWEGVDLKQLEELRLRLRGLVPFLDKKARKMVYTDFNDEVLGVREEAPVAVPKMTGAQYAKKVADYLRDHLDHMVIHQLRTNKPLTPTNLEELEKTLTEIGQEDGESLLSGLLAQSSAPSPAHFICSVVGMDRAAAQAAFSKLLGDRSLTVPQIRFIDMIIDQLTARGVMEAFALYEPPFSNLHAGGPDALFAGKEKVIDRVFETLESLEPRIQTVAR